MALLGRSPDSGRNYLGQVVELAHRLPPPWARVLDDRCRRGRHCGSPTTPGSCLPTPPVRRPAARHVRPRHDLGPGRPTRRGSTRAVRPRRRRRTQAGVPRPPPRRHRPRRRRLRRHRPPTGTLDAADALDLEQAIARRAKLAGQLGDTDTLDVRRAKALGEIAREDLALDLPVTDPDTAEIIRAIPGGRPSWSSTSPRPTTPWAGSPTPAPRSAWSRSRNGSVSPGSVGDRPPRDRPRRAPARGLL